LQASKNESVEGRLSLKKQKRKQSRHFSFLCLPLRLFYPNLFSHEEVSKESFMSLL